MSDLTPISAADAAVPAAADALLRECGAWQTPHSGRVLYAHLLGTFRVLKAWGNPQAVCLAGLFHSLYGSNAFTRQSLPAQQRARLVDVIGAEAEALAWLFCNIDRPRAITAALQAAGQRGSGVIPVARRRDSGDPRPLDMTVTQLRALAEIECANLLEQGFVRGDLRDLYCACLDKLAVSNKALRALRMAFATALAQDNRRTETDR